MIKKSKNIENARRVNRARVGTKQALRERGGAPRNDKLRQIMVKYYRIIHELEEVLHLERDDFTEEQANKLVEQLKQLEAFIRATKNVK